MLLNILLIASAVLLQQTKFAAAFIAHHHDVLPSRNAFRMYGSTTRSTCNVGNQATSIDETAASDDGADDVLVDSTRRRDVFRRILAAGGISSSIVLTAGTCQPTTAVASAGSTQSQPYGTPDKPVLILGGNGRTGMQVVESLASGSVGQAMHVVVTTRTGKDPFAKIKLPTDTKDYIASYSDSVDVRSLDSIMKAVKDTNAGAIVFAASASKSGGNAAQVDGDGPTNAAKAAKATGAKLVLVSALALDRPDSKSYQITNTMGGFIDKIMDEKLRGEEDVRNIMGRGKGDYAIVRPGPLFSGKSKNGAVDIELNQGDTVGGGLSRDELAGIVVGALQAEVRGVTVECYRSKTATALQPDFFVPSGNELRASSYAGLFDGAKKDV